MKKYVYLVFLLVLATGSFFAGSWYSLKQPAADSASQGRRVLYYVDPMNPAHTSDKPGLAPCGMKMEAVYADAGATGQDSAHNLSAMPPGTVKISPERQQLIGLQVTTAETAPWNGTIRLLGRVTPDETRIYRINAATDGWIKKILPVTTGTLVQKDELLATFYAPEFFSAMKAYLYGLRSLGRFQNSGMETKEQLDSTDGQIDAYRNSLRNLGMSEHQLDTIKQTQQGGEQVEIRAPEAGFILIRNFSLNERFQRGTELCRIADLRHVWIAADIFENESKYFQPGAQVTVTHPTLHKTFQGRVSAVLPQFDPITRTLKVRIETENPDFTLRPDMFVDVDFPVTLPSMLTVPSDAVLDSGLKKTVFVDRGNGFFEPRAVETGRRLRDKVEITGGLMPGERIVSSGNFLIDSESRMKMAAADMHPGSQQPQPAQATSQAAALLAKCPVCGMEVNTATAQAQGLTVDHQGKTYYFCSTGDKQLFEKDPDRYIAKPQAAEAAPPAPEVHPAMMQPQPTQATNQEAALPAKCPVCGMEVDTATAQAQGLTADHQGKTYYFCSIGDKQLFEKDPDRYIAKPQATEAAPLAPEVHPATMPPQPAKAAQQEAALPAKCPVCGMDVDTATAQAQGLTVDYQGTTYYFCSTGDKQLFEKDPGSYTAKPRLTEAAPPAPDLQAARRARRLNRAMGR